MQESNIIKTIAIKAYHTPEGKPTCAVDISGGKMCKFYRTRSYGFVEICAFTERTITRADSRSGEKGFGYTIPVNDCPIWSES